MYLIYHMTSYDPLIGGHVNLSLEVLAVRHHPDKSCDHTHCDSRDIMFLICHVTPRESREHEMFKGLFKFMGGNHS